MNKVIQIKAINNQVGLKLDIHQDRKNQIISSKQGKFFG
jgi:hypothetical protein